MIGLARMVTTDLCSQWPALAIIRRRTGNELYVWKAVRIGRKRPMPQLDSSGHG